MKTILLIIPYGSVGGMERLAQYFYKEYKNKGYPVKVIKLFGLETDIINFYKDEFVLSKKDLYQLNLIDRILFYFSAPLKIRRIIKQYNITNSISFGDLTNVFSALTFTNEKKIGSIHALKSVELSSNSLFSLLTKFSYRTSYMNFDKLVCISHAIKNDLINNCAYRFQSNLKVIYNPHDIDNIIKLSKDPIKEDKEIQIFKNDVILFLGRMSIQKSPWHLINAFSLLKEKGKINLVFIGDGDPEVLNYLKKLIKKRKIKSQVFFLGRKSNPYKYLARAKILALSSHYEGTPNVIVEAITLNTPVVSSNCTNGIVELMSLNTDFKQSYENMIVEGGIITPNLFKGKLGIPNTSKVFKEEILLADALNQVLSSIMFKERLVESKNALLKKFDLEMVTEEYIN